MPSRVSGLSACEVSMTASTARDSMELALARVRVALRMAARPIVAPPARSYRLGPRLVVRPGFGTTTHGSPVLTAGRGAPAKISMTLLEDSPAVEGDTELVLALAVSMDAPLGVPWMEEVAVTARPTAAPENSTLTVVVVAERAASRFGATRAGGRSAPLLTGRIGGDSARAASEWSHLE